MADILHPFQTVPPRLWIALAAALLVSACDDFALPQAPPTLAEAEDTVQFVTVPLHRAWVNVPDAVVVSERGLVNSVEQRIGLVNRTAVPGDNIIVLRARVRQGQLQGRLRYKEFMQRVGGLPVPFTDLRSGDLMTGEDGLGTYLWAEKRVGGNMVCVLGLRRMDQGGKQLPEDTNVLDMMMRNCVIGEAPEALAPMLAETLGDMAGATAATDSGEIRMLSPLAGPTP